MSRLTASFASVLLMFALVAGLGAACGVGKTAKTTCEQYRDDVIERRLDSLSLPDLDKDQVQAELEKHRAVMVKVHGKRLIKECEQKRGESR